MEVILRVILIFAAVYFTRIVEAQYSSEDLSLPCTTLTCEGEIKKVVERIRKIIKFGDSELGIPSFDPLEVAPFFHQFDEEMIRGNVSLSETFVRGITNFTLSKGKLTIIPTTLSLGVNFSSLIFDTNYVGNIRMLKVLNLFGNGHMRMKFTNLDIQTILYVTLTNPIQITDLTLDITLPSIEAKITGLYGDEYMSTIISKRLSRSLQTLVTEEKEKINIVLYDVLWHIIVNVINPILAKEKKEMDLSEIPKVITRHPIVQDWFNDNLNQNTLY
ncbi:hypothetical protein ILUMI_25037 [Ignelater luminosus]|uniref:Uncharacterized protein n=1 Tax=Ignelater luminosus TaxID=2038154 RepID=A0A8K0C9B6_IGNLU|nr:hypothetical protein ILUMI_25037 [Ignelater luminosus]